jgi:hypothetical protein
MSSGPGTISARARPDGMFARRTSACRGRSDLGSASAIHTHRLFRRRRQPPCCAPSREAMPRCRLTGAVAPRREVRGQTPRIAGRRNTITQYRSQRTAGSGRGFPPCVRGDPRPVGSPSALRGNALMSTRVAAYRVLLTTARVPDRRRRLGRSPSRAYSRRATARESRRIGSRALVHRVESPGRQEIAPDSKAGAYSWRSNLFYLSGIGSRAA